MEQCRADPCVYRKIVEGVVSLILVVHVDNILLVSGEKSVGRRRRVTSYTIH